MDTEVPEKKKRVPKVAKVKNKAPAPVQITAEQLLREAKERQLEFVPPPPKQKITDPDELQAYRLRKRKAFEDSIRKNRNVMSNWIKYAQWEESQKEIQRARSVYERALDVDHRCIPIWLKYAEMEMKHRQVNHARNIWDRAVTVLPRASQFWYKYTYMEEMLDNIPGARQVFERWMEWEPEEQAWFSYIKMELRYKEVNRARSIYERFVMVHSDVKNWIKFAKFEESQGKVDNARLVYERAIEFFGDDNMDERLFIAFAKFEENQRELERVRVVYKYAIEHIPKQHSEDLFKKYTIFEKRFGDRSGIEDVIVSKRKFQYEEEVKMSPNNYDAWFDYLRLMESEADDIDIVRDVYERAIGNIPPVESKKHWRRYIYLWINYALYEELIVKDIEKTREVYRACLDLIPHKKFTFAKVWLLYAQFEIRQKNLKGARQAMGTALGKCPKNKLFREYIALEQQLHEYDRCRKLYEKHLEFDPSNCSTWIKYCEMEMQLGEVERCRALYELAVNQGILDMPEVLWKAYIDFEIAAEESDRVRQLYERLLERTQHVKVWISYAQFEANSNDPDCLSFARNVYDRGDRSMQTSDSKEERLLLLESWKDFEVRYGDELSQAAVEKKIPRKVKKRRKVQTDDGSDSGWEEYYDYIFPDDESNQPNFKLLQMAQMWKHAKDIASDEDDEASDSDEDKRRDIIRDTSKEDNPDEDTDISDENSDSD